MRSSLCNSQPDVKVVYFPLFVEPQPSGEFCGRSLPRTILFDDNLPPFSEFVPPLSSFDWIPPFYRDIPFA